MQSESIKKMYPMYKILEVPALIYVYHVTSPIL